jgi:hypothetical protein
MITVEEVKAFLQSAGSDYSEEQITECITIATERAKKLLGAEELPQTPEVKRAILYLTVAELGMHVNLFYRKDGGEYLRIKDLISEAERLLGVFPKGGHIVWQTT